MDDFVRTYDASVKMSTEFILIKTYSGLGLKKADPKGAEHYLPVDASDVDLGIALLDALSKSRLVMPDYMELIHEGAVHDPIFSSNFRAKTRYEEWIAKVMKTYGYKTKRALFKGMKNCSIQKKLDEICMIPTNHDRVERWTGDGISEDDYIYIPADSSAEEVGKALRLCISRCI